MNYFYDLPLEIQEYILDLRKSIIITRIYKGRIHKNNCSYLSSLIYDLNLYHNRNSLDFWKYTNSLELHNTPQHFIPWSSITIKIIYNIKNFIREKLCRKQKYRLMEYLSENNSLSVNLFDCVWRIYNGLKLCSDNYNSLTHLPGNYYIIKHNLRIIQPIYGQLRCILIEMKFINGRKKQQQIYPFTNENIPPHIDATGIPNSLDLLLNVWQKSNSQVFDEDSDFDNFDLYDN